MVTKIPVSGGSAALPFVWECDGRMTLTDSLYRALDRAIAEGKYGEGDVLPPRDKLAGLLGVSEHVVRSALARLQAEGKVVARPRLGVRVLAARNDRLLCGSVLMVRPEGLRGSYSWAVTDAVLKRTFESEGLRYETVFADSGLRKLRDRLSGALALSPEIVVYRSDSIRTTEAERMIGRSGRPYVYSGFGKPWFGSCVGRYFEDFSGACADFLSACANARVMSVCQIGFGPDRILNLIPDFERSGVSAERLDIGRASDFDSLEAVQRAALEAMKSRLRMGALPELLFFTDDYVAMGAMTALMESGVRVPQDVKVVTVANHGLGPVYSQSLSRIEFDASESARILAENVRMWLRTNHFPDAVVYAPHYVPGETLC